MDRIYNETIDSPAAKQKDAGSDIRAQSSDIGSETYMIIATDHSEKFDEITRRYNIGYKKVIGKYQSHVEIGYIVNASWLATLTPALEGQESILVLGPTGRRGIRPATIHYLDWRRVPTSLGYFVDTPTDMVGNRDYTYDPTTAKYYTCAHNAPELQASGSFSADFVNATEADLGLAKPTGEWTFSSLNSEGDRVISARRFSDKATVLRALAGMASYVKPRVLALTTTPAGQWKEQDVSRDELVRRAYEN